MNQKSLYLKLTFITVNHGASGKSGGNLTGNISTGSLGGDLKKWLVKIGSRFKFLGLESGSGLERERVNY